MLLSIIIINILIHSKQNVSSENKHECNNSGLNLTGLTGGREGLVK